MKKILLIVAILSFASHVVAEESWWNKVLNVVGLGEDITEQVQGPDLTGLLNSVTSNLGVTTEQAQGGMAALFNYAKQNVSNEQFAMLAEKVPGLDSVMQYLPIVEEVSRGGLGGLMDKAASFNENLGQLNQLNKQFESLGLDTAMIKGYARQATQYLDTPQGQEAKNILTDSLFKI